MGQVRGDSSVFEEVGVTMGVILADQPDLWKWANEAGPTEIERFIVWLLKQATSEKPLGIAEIRVRVREELKEMISEREIKGFIRDLRREHGMAVLARRGSPSGYYLCSNREEMKRFASAFIAQANDEMETIRKILRRNYPSLMGELKIGATYEEISDGQE
jgi:hypothetical protein